MANVQMKRCDRPECGRIFEPTKERHKTILVQYESDSKVDLCGECYDVFRKWLGERVHVKRGSEIE